MTKHWLNPLRRSLKSRTPYRHAKPRFTSRLHTLELLERRDAPAAFSAGNIIVYRVGDGATVLNANGNAIFIDEYTPAGGFVQTIPMPTSGAGQIISSGTATAEGYMQLSGDGKYVTIPGYNADLSTNTIALSGSVPATINRVATVMDISGTTITYASLNNVNGALRSAVTNNGKDVYLSSSSFGVGFAPFGSATATQMSASPTNTRNIQIFGGQLYITSMSGSTRFGTVGTGVPTTTGQTINNLPGPASWIAPNNHSPYGMFFADLDGAVAGVDTAYFLDDSSNTTSFAGLNKLTKDLSGNWSFTGSSVKLATGSLRGLTGSVSGNTVTLYATHSSGSTSAPVSGVVSIVDNGGFGGSITNTFNSVVTAPAAAFKTAFRGITFVPNNTTTVVTKIDSTPTTISSPSTNFTVTFNTAISGLTAGNFDAFSTGDLAAIDGGITVGTPTTSNGMDWTVPVSGLLDSGTVRLDLISTFGISPTPGTLFNTGTVVTVDLEGVGATLDIVAGNAVFRGGKGIGDNVTLDVSGSSVTLNDTSGVITVTAAAQTAGWTGNGTNTVANLAANVPLLKVRLGSGVDTLTVNKVNVPLDVSGGLDVGDNANFPVTLTYAGSAAFTSFDSIAVAAGVTVAIDSITLGASGIGAAGVPVRTNSKSVTAISTGSNGINIEEIDGASFAFTASGGGSVNIETLSGALTIGGKSTWDSGTVTLKSPDDVVINADVGTPLVTTGGLVILANADGIGSQGYTQSTTAKLNTTASGSFSITVNTPSGGTGDAVLGQGRTDTAGFTWVDANGGDILWNPLFVIPALDTANNEVLTSGDFTLKTSGATSSIGDSTSPLQLNDSTLPGDTEATAGSGGVYITRSGSGTASFNVTATGAGNIQLWARNGSNTSIEVSPSGVHTDTGSIWIRSWKYIQVNGLIGGLNPATSNNMSGTILLEANISGADSQLIYQTAAIETTNNSANAVIMRSSGVTNSAAFGVGGIRIANITVGAGGTVTIDAAYNLGVGSDSIRAGAISRNTGTSISAPGGTVILNAKDDHIGTVFQPITIDAANVTATTNSTNTKITSLGSVTSIYNTEQDEGDIFLSLTSSATNVAAITTTKNSIDANTVTRVGDISIVSTGSLTVNGKTKTDTGNIDLNSGSSIGLGADLGDGTSGTITLNAAGAITQTAGVVNTTATLLLNTPGNTATFVSTGNKAGLLVVPSTVTAIVDGSFDASGAVQVDGTLGGKGSVGTTTVSGSGKVTPGTSPGKLGTGNVVFNSGSTFHVELNGGVAGTSYDQLAVTGTVDLNNATLTGSLGFTPSGGQIFRIIDNDGSDTIATTFNGIAEGGNVVLGSTTFTLSYVGGDGNDVTLKAPGVSTAPKINGVIFGDGAAQRSMIQQLVVNFSEPVTFSGDVTAAITLSRNQAGSTQPGGNGPVTLTPSQAFGTLSSVTFTFSGGLTSNGSLMDGFYDFLIDADQITGPGGNLDGENNPAFPSGNGTAGGDYIVTGTTTNGFFRIFGDADGNASPNLLDFAEFRNVFLNTASSIFDYHGGGAIPDLIDFAEFRGRFLLAP